MLKKIFNKLNDLATMPVLFSWGNVPIYLSTFLLGSTSPVGAAVAGTGLVLSALAALSVTTSRLIEMHCGIEKQNSTIPHFTLSAFNFGAAGASTLGLATGMITLSPLSLGMTTAFAGWGVANLLRGIEKHRGENLEGVLKPSVWWPLSDIAATFHTAAWPAGLIALAKDQFLDRPDVRSMDVHTMKDFLIKHVSWDRILGAMTLGAAAFSPPYVALGFGLFVAGYYMNGEYDLNKTFFPDLKKALACEAKL